MRGGQWRGLVGRWQSILIIAGVEGTICSYGSLWTGPTGPTIHSPIMESDICESMDPQSRFGKFAIMGPFVCLAFLTRSHDLIIR